MVAGAFVGFPVSAALLFLSVRHLHGDELRASLRDARLPFLASAAALMSVVYVLQAARWRVLANAGDVRLTRFVRWEVACVAVNNVVPGRVGDVLRAEWLSRGTRRARASSISSVIVDRGFDIVTLVAALALTYPFVPHAAWLRDLRLVAGAVGLLVGASFLAAVVYARRSRASARRGLLGMLTDVVQRTGDVFHRRSGARAGLLSAMAWAAWSVSAWLVASALGIALTPVEALFVTAVLNLGAAIPSSPGFIGTYQWLGVSALTVLGVGHTRAFAFSVLMHAVWFVPTTMAGAALALFKSTPAATGLPNPVRRSTVDPLLPMPAAPAPTRSTRA